MRSSAGTNQAIMNVPPSKPPFTFFSPCPHFFIFFFSCLNHMAQINEARRYSEPSPLRHCSARYLAANLFSFTPSLSPSLPLSPSVAVCSFCFFRACVPVKKLLTSHSVWGWIEISHRVCTNMQGAHFDRCHQRTSIWITRQPAIPEFRQNGINTRLRSKQQHNNNMKARATGSR